MVRRELEFTARRGEIGGLKGRLNNPKFAENAPEEVVAEAQDNLAARQEEEATLKAAMKRLEDMG